jgi:hypothetical protein
MAHQDGRCATIAETIYVQMKAGCNDSVTATDPGAGTSGQPLCSMQPAPMLLSATRDLILARGTVSGGSWNLTTQASETSIVGQQSASVASATNPGFSMQSGAVYIRDLEFSSSGSMGISASGGTLRLQHVTVDNCKHGGVLLDGAGFDIENTTVSNNMAGTFNVITNWGGILINNPPTSGPAALEFVSVLSNAQIGITCSTSIAATGVSASGNAGGDISSGCGFSSCGTASSTCGAQ